MSGSTISCKAEASTAAKILLRVSQAKKIANRVFRPKSGLKPKKTPIATPPAIATGVSRMASSFSECSCNQRRGFIRFVYHHHHSIDRLDIVKVPSESVHPG